MQIQKGLVKYKDRTDIVCTYGLTQEGKQYYFLDNTSMSNGNIIASTVLVEAVDPVVVASSIGVIDPNGVVVIPFENKSIKPIVEGLLLVEVSNSTTPSVVEANSLRSDPLSATKLVTTPATIKDKINAKMGSEGRFIFNDQFSEATICDYSGNNILDNQYFSFIAIKNNETLYLCKNTVDSPVLEYSLINRMFVSKSEEAPLDVQNTEVTQETIDGAMKAEEKVVGFNISDITEKDFQSVMDGTPVEEPLPVEPSVVDPSAMPVVPADVTAPAETSAEGENEENIDDDGEEPISVIPDSINQDVAPEENAETGDVNALLPIAENNVEAPVGVVNEVPVGETTTEENVETGDVNVSLPTDGNNMEASVESENPVDVINEVPVGETFEDAVIPEENITVDAVVPVENEGMPSEVPETVLPEDVTETAVESEVPEEVVAEENFGVDTPVEETATGSVEESIDAFDEAFANAVAEVPTEETAPVEEEASEIPAADDKLMEFDFGNNDNYSNDTAVEETDDLGLSTEDVVSEFKNDLFDVDLESDIFADSTLKADKIDVDDGYHDFGYKIPGAKDSIIEDVASTMSNLIRQNKLQKQTIASYEEKMDQAAAAYKKVVDKARSQLRDVEVLKNKLKNYETIVTKLEAKLEVLESKVRDQDKVIASQTRELESLRPQVEGKEELVKILADAQNLLDQSI